LIYVYNDRDVHLGELRVVASLKGVYARILDRVWVILCVQAVKIFLVSLFIVFLFYRLVGKHIITMASYVESMGFDAMDQPLHLNRKRNMKRPDEVEQLATSVNRMRENLARYITENKRAEKELEGHREHLEELVREKTKDLRKIIKAMSDREVRMSELKGEIKVLRERLGDVEASERCE
jgi:methyl-accepting chemotaxis protein